MHSPSSSASSGSSHSLRMFKYSWRQSPCHIHATVRADIASHEATVSDGYIDEALD